MVREFVVNYSLWEAKRPSLLSKTIAFGDQIWHFWWPNLADLVTKPGTFGENTWHFLNSKVPIQLNPSAYLAQQTGALTTVWKPGWLDDGLNWCLLVPFLALFLPVKNDTFHAIWERKRVKDTKSPVISCTKRPICAASRSEKLAQNCPFVQVFSLKAHLSATVFSAIFLYILSQSVIPNIFDMCGWTNLNPPRIQVSFTHGLINRLPGTAKLSYKNK